MVVLCQAEVNNVPEDSEEWIVARWNPEINELWYWGSWSDKNQAKEIAKLMDGILLRKTTP